MFTLERIEVFILLLLFFFILSLRQPVVSSNVSVKSTTTLKPIVERVFSRKKRLVLFPKGSNLKFTGTVSKHLLSRYPRGAGFTYEAAIYYPVPGHRDDLYPKRLLKPTTTTPKPKGPTVPTEPTLVYIPGTDIRYKAKPIAKPKPIKLHRIDDEPNRWIDTGSYVNSEKWSKYGQKYANWTTVHDYNKYSRPWQPASNAKWTRWTTPRPKWSNYGGDAYDNGNWRQDGYHQRWYRSTSEVEEEEEDDTLNYEPTTEPFEPYDYPDLDRLLEWRHYHGHRDRRQLFDHFGGLSQLLGLDMKYCILRAMCESKRLLLPPGYSMLHDIMRVILTMPTINGLEDDYSRVMRQNTAGCAASLRGKCNISLITWLLGTKWHSTITEQGQ